MDKQTLDMKKILFVFALICLIFNSYGQNNVGIGTPNPDPSAVLDLTSTSQGFLVPRTQVALIGAPVRGLVIYDTDTLCYVMYNGSSWKNLCNPSIPTSPNAFNDVVRINPDGTVTVIDSNGNRVLTSTLAAWLTTGNSGTSAGTNFIGTTDGQDLVVKTNNNEVMRATQLLNVGIGTTTPNTSAVLDLTSATRGFLAPRSQVALIAAPIAGLIIYDTDSSCYVVYNGTNWKNLCVPNVNLGPAFNTSVNFNPDGTVTVVDSLGLHSVTSPQSAWLTSGNSGTTAGTNFAGTTDAQDFVLKSNNAEVLRATTAGAVGINQPTPDINAILDINSTTKGVLFPSLTSGQIAAIATPTVGLTVYNNTINVHQFWNGTCWANVGQTVCSFDYSVSQSHSTDCLFKSNFGSVSDTITVSLVSGTASPVILSAAGVPAGVLVNFSNNYLIPTTTSIMTMTALPSAANGTYTITILAASGSTIRTLTYTLTVFDFAVTLSPASSTITLAQAQAGGIVASSTVTIGNPSACTASAGNATLSYSVTPVNPGILVSFANPNPSVPGSTTMDITSSCALQGTYQVIVTSVVGVSTSTAIYTITISGPAPIHISASVQNVNLFVLAGQPTCAVVDTVIVDAGVIVGSATTGQSSMVTGGFTNGSRIVIINNGTIAGAGGAGGDKAGYGFFASCTGVGDGGNGGNAITISTSGVTIINQGVIGGGGGGGAAGADLSITPCTFSVRAGSGGGGGAGAQPGAAGSNAGGGNPGNAGNAGTLNTGGTGGAQTVWGPCFLSFGSTYHNGNGGNGGDLGMPGIPNGSPGGAGTSNFAGAAGVCPRGNPGQPGCGVKDNTLPYVYLGTAPVGTSPTCP
ncbi:MAG: hypothetical protein JWO03_557 [Bacteroidetes bacterium]|nr:hypothetical protein [Bacteroidota bacterium]